MTFEELKAEAKRQGYKLMKKQENVSVRLLPCTCGVKRPTKWYVIGDDNVGECYKCDKCGKRGKTGKNTREAKINWNVEVEVEE